MSGRLPAITLMIGLLSIPAASPGQANDTDGAIRNLQVSLKLHPDDFKAFAGLGAAYLQKGRETGDAADYELARSALSKSLSLVSNDPAAAFAMTQMAVALMAEHRFADAYSWAQRALSAGSGDPSPWAIAGDALADVGDYQQAAEAYSRLTCDFGSDDEQQAIAYQRESRMSYLRFVAGDTRGAIQRMSTALQIANELHMPAENIAWSNYQLGEEYLQSGDLQLAEKAYQEALLHYPGYYRALAGMAKVRSFQNDLRGAAEFYEKAIATVPYPEYAAALGDLYQATGQAGKARREYDLVDFIGHLSQINAEIHNRDLAFFYADHGVKLEQAVTLARRELEVRQDIYTWDVLAWALYKHGNLKEGSDAMTHALSQGTRDALLYFHAGMIDAALGDSARAREFFERTLELNPHFHPVHANEARQTLAKLATVAGASSMEVSDARR